MELIEPTDPQYFEQTSDELYDRHDYKVFKTTGKFVLVDSWEMVYSLWWNSPPKFLSHIEVVDKKKSGGFK